ncbi:MAG TPA: PD-(D/E)XK nuclease family protein, partial [Chthonomonadales bacterium]|nr:PD-(D/E)XK nuclease family protein [Chthonomonadales bacterium]
WDEDDLPRLAAEKLDLGAPIPNEARCVLVDGFYRFPRVWCDLLAAFARRGLEVVVTLPYEEARPLLFAASARTLALFRAEFSVEEVMLSAPGPSGRPSALYTLEREIFKGVKDAGKRNKAESLTLFDAPNAYTEVEMAARALLREHNERGTPWNRCAIIARTPGDYADILAAVCERYGIPLAISRTQVVAENPLIRALITLLNVFLCGWQRDDVIAFLKSSYTSADKLAADRLHLCASRRGLREGREGWQRLTEDMRDAHDPLTPMLEKMLAWHTELHAQPCQADGFREALERLCVDFSLADSAEPGDRAALKQASEVLAEIALTARLTGREPASLAEFCDQAIAGWRTATYVPPLPRDAVTLIEPLEVGARDLAFVIVMGLIERVFPRQAREDPFLRDDERVILCKVGLPLEAHGERADDERLLFYQAIAAPSERLVLSYPRAEEESDTLRSFYIDEVLDLFEHVPTVTRLLTDVTPRPEECATPRDRILAACAEIADARERGSPHNITPTLSWLDGAERATVAEIEKTCFRPRLARLESGVLRHTLAAPRRYTVSEIETYLRCPFQYLAKYGMKLRTLPEGAGAADRGRIHHAVLRRHFRARAECEDILSAAEMCEELLKRLQECLTEHPPDARPHRVRMMERALQDVLRGFARREEPYRKLFNLLPAYFELRFGLEEDPGEPEDEPAEGIPEECDPASTARPLLIPASDGGPPIEICGVIDRVDVASDGVTALVMDYKTGKSVPFEEIRNGKSLQMPVYLMALEQLWGLTGAIGCYDSPHDSGRRRFYRQDKVDIQRFKPVPGEDGKLVKPVGPEKWGEVLQTVQDTIRWFASQIREANVLPAPGDHCRFCIYGDICRTSRDNVHDGEPVTTFLPAPTPPFPAKMAAGGHTPLQESLEGYETAAPNASTLLQSAPGKEGAHDSGGT